MSKYLNLISYFGGKFPHLNWLIPKFPAGNYHFVDLMCGSANVALNVNYPLITINDLNDEVINLFKVLRDNPEELIRQIYFTPFSRAELNKIISDSIDNLKFDNIERARRYFVKCQLGYGANGSQNNHYGLGFEFTISRFNYYRVDNWNEKMKKLPAIIDRLRGFQIENRNALDLFDQVNKPDKVVYIDPPYVLETRKSKKRYMHEVENDFHIKLSEKIKTAKCYLIISGYDHPLYDDLFSLLQKTKNKETRSSVGKNLSQECIWTNYDPETINGLLKIDFHFEDKKLNCY